MATLDLSINSHLRVPLAELRYQFARSSGPGGQHVNKTESQVELTFDVAHSPSLTDVQRQRVLHKLKNLIDTDGVLHLTAQSERSQLRNREAVTARFQQVLAQALHVPKQRRPTKPSAASKEKRIASKKQHGRIKQLRRQRPEE